MSGRPWRTRLEDIQESIANIQRFIAGMSEADFAADKKTVHAVLYELGVIGEAVRHIPPEVEQRYPLVPWRQMRGMRNVVVHEYFRVEVQILWETATRNLASVTSMVQDILDRES